MPGREADASIARNDVFRKALRPPMIVGIGSDVLEVARVARELARHGAFVGDSIFTPREAATCAAAPHPERGFAACFASKEAVLKALGTGAADLAELREVEIDAPARAVPRVTLHGRPRATAARLGVRHISLSLSHTPEVAAAFAILEN